MLRANLLGQDNLSANLQCQSNLIARLMEGSGLDSVRVESDTTAGWNSQTTYVPKKDTIIVYSDYKTIVQDGVTKLVAGVKIADGSAYVVDLPFIDDELRAELENHIADKEVHLQEGERDFWNSKINCVLDGEILEFYREKRS